MTWRPRVQLLTETAIVDVPDSYVLSQLTVTHGRTDLSTQPPPAVATVSFLADTVDPDYYRLGVLLQLTVYPETDPYDMRTVFIGSVTDCTMDRTVLTVTATSSALGVLARIPSKISTDRGRLWPVLGDAFEQALTDYPGLVTLVAPDVFDPPSGSSLWPLVATDWERQPAVTTLQTIAGYDPVGLLVENPRSNQVIYLGGKERRKALETPAELNAAAVVDTWTATKSVTTKVNKATVSYGADAVTVSAKDTDDIAVWGLYEQAVETRLEESADASVYARWLVARGKTPGWTLPAVTVDMDRWTGSDDWLTSGRVGQAFTFETPPSPVMPDVVCVEGWTLRSNGRSLYADFYVSDPELTLLPQTWDDVADVAPTLTWATVASSVTWDTLLTTDL